MSSPWENRPNQMLHTENSGSVRMGLLSTQQPTGMNGPASGIAYSKGNRNDVITLGTLYQHDREFDLRYDLNYLASLPPLNENSHISARLFTVRGGSTSVQGTRERRCRQTAVYSDAK